MKKEEKNKLNRDIQLLENKLKISKDVNEISRTNKEIDELRNKMFDEINYKNRKKKFNKKLNQINNNLKGNGFGINRIFGLLKKQDKYKKKNSKSSRKKFRKIQLKKDNLIEDLQNKYVHHICNNYTHIIIPPYNVSEMVNYKKKKRKLNKKTTRKLINFNNYECTKKFQDKSDELNVKMNKGTEEYTSCTCSKCFMINHKIGGSRWFKCSYCKHEQDRDWNAPRNTFFKNITNFGNEIKILRKEVGANTLDSLEVRFD